MNDLADIPKLFSNIEESLERSKNFLQLDSAYENLDLQNLDSEIASLCEKIISLPVLERNIHEKRLRDLFESLNELGEMMKKNINITAIPQFKNASIAYKTADSRDNFGKKHDE